jgi:hypothetical protein
MSVKTVYFTSPHPEPYPWRTKINPLWWVNNDEANSSDSFAFSYLRNLGMNFKRYVVGVYDRSHWVSGRGPDPTIVMRSDVGETGWHWSVIWLCGVPLLPFVSYSGTNVEWYIGWQASGRLDVKWNHLGDHWQLW